MECIDLRSLAMPPILVSSSNRRKKTCKELFYNALQVVHFFLAMGFLWAGIVEFIKNPPYFDAYGDASTRNDLPEGLFEVNFKENFLLQQNSAYVNKPYL